MGTSIRYLILSNISPIRYSEQTNHGIQLYLISNKNPVKLQRRQQFIVQAKRLYLNSDPGSVGSSPANYRIPILNSPRDVGPKTFVGPANYIKKRIRRNIPPLRFN